MYINLERAYQQNELNESGIYKRNLYNGIAYTGCAIVLASLVVAAAAFLPKLSDSNIIILGTCPLYGGFLGAMVLGTAASCLEDRLTTEEQKKYLKENSSPKAAEPQKEAEPKHSEKRCDMINRIYNSLFPSKVEPYPTEDL